MKIRILLCGALCLFTLGCDKVVSNLGFIDKSCFDDLELSKIPTYDYGEWTYKPVPLTNWLACLPSNSDLYNAHKDLGPLILFSREHPEWLEDGMAWLRIPSSEAREWLLGKMPNEDPWIGFFIVPVSDEWNGKLVDWITKEFGGMRYKNSDHCASGSRGVYKTIRDYPSPHYIEFQTSVLKLKNVQGEFVRFESCKEWGEWYAVLVKDRVFLLGEDIGTWGTSSEELLQKIIENIRVNEGAK